MKVFITINLVLILTIKVFAQCINDSECRSGRVCIDGRCVYKKCRVDIDCPEPLICEDGRCVQPIFIEEKKKREEKEEILLEPPTPKVLFSFKEKKELKYLYPAGWGSRGIVPTLPPSGSIFEIAYIGGDYLSKNYKGSVSGFQLMTGSESTISSIFNIGIYYSVLQYTELNVGYPLSPSLGMGDLSFKFLVILLSRGCSNYWLGLSPYIRFNVNFGSYDVDYLFLLEAGLSFGFVYKLFSLTFNGEFISFFEEEKKVFGSIFYIAPAVNLTSFLAILLNLELGYVGYEELPNFVSGLYPAIRFIIKDKVDIDIVFKIALNDGGIYIDQGSSIIGSFGVGMRLNVIWSRSSLHRDLDFQLYPD